MRRLIPLMAVALALGAAAPSTALAADTVVQRHGETVGSLVHQGGSRYKIEDSSYSVEGEVRRIGKRRFEFSNGLGKFGWAVRTGSRWDVYSSQHPSDRIGYVQKVGARRWAAYVDGGERVGESIGQAALQGAASALLVFH